MYGIQNLGANPQYQLKPNFKAETRTANRPMSQEDMFLKMVAEQKKKEKQQKYTRWAMTGLQAIALLSMIAIGIPTIKQLLKKKGNGPTDAERELGVKTKEEIMKMFKDVSREKSFEDLEMTGTLKEQLNKVIDNMNRKSRYTECALEPQNTFLFYGPPGTGKTSFVNALCKKLGVNPFVFDIGELKGGYQGTLEKNLNTSVETFLETHRAARAKDPNHKSIFFFDECDEVLQLATGANKNSDNQIFTRLKRNIEQIQKEDGVYIFLNSNKNPHELEEAIVSRARQLFIPRPTADALIKNHISHFKNCGDSVANDVKTESDRLKQFYEIMAKEGHGYAYREQAKFGWKNIPAPQEGQKLELNDFINAAIASTKELNLTPTEIGELKNLLN